MSNKKVNSRNTENPYELISGVQLSLKGNKNVKLCISATKFSYVSNKKGKKDLIMLNFDINSKYEAKYKEDYNTIKVFKNIEHFAKMNNNPLEVITMFVDVYKKNKDKLFIKFTTCPVYNDALDSKFVYESLINN